MKKKLMKAYLRQILRDDTLTIAEQIDMIIRMKKYFRKMKKRK